MQEDLDQSRGVEKGVETFVEKGVESLKHR